MKRILTSLAVVGFLWNPASTRAQDIGPANGSLVIVGGAMRDTAIINRFIQLAGGLDAPLVLIPTAGGGEAYDEFWSGARAFAPLFVEERARLAAVLGDDERASNLLRKARDRFGEVAATGHVERLGVELGG